MYKKCMIISAVIACLSGYPVPMLQSECFAVTRYVSLTGTNDAANGYTNWVGAATNIQLAVNASTAGDMVLVTNGTYCLTNEPISKLGFFDE